MSLLINIIPDFQHLEQETQLSQRDRSMLRVTEYIHSRSVKFIRNDSLEKAGTMTTAKVMDVGRGDLPSLPSDGLQITTSALSHALSQRLSDNVDPLSLSTPRNYHYPLSKLPKLATNARYRYLNRTSVFTGSPSTDDQLTPS